MCVLHRQRSEGCSAFQTMWVAYWSAQRDSEAAKTHFSGAQAVLLTSGEKTAEGKINPFFFYQKYKHILSRNREAVCSRVGSKG